MMHKQLLLALMAAYPVQYFLIATLVVVATVCFCINAKNKGESRGNK